MKKNNKLTEKDFSLESLAITTQSLLVANKFGFTINYELNKLKTFHDTYAHFIKNKKNQKIFILNNYRGDLISSNGKFILTGRKKNPGVANLHMFLPLLAFEKNIILITPPLDKKWIDYLSKCSLFPKNFDIKSRVLPVNLPEMGSSPIEAILTSGLDKQIPIGSLLITTFNDRMTKILVKKRKLIHNQFKIDSYQGNSKIDQRKNQLPMPPSISVKNNKETMLAAKKLLTLGVKKIWIKCGNNVGSGQFMRSVLLKNTKKSLQNIIDLVTEIHSEQCELMGKPTITKGTYTHAEIMLETDIHQFGKVLFEGSVCFVNDFNNCITLCDYTVQIKDTKDSSICIGGANFIPKRDSIETIFPELMQQIAIYAADRQRKRNYIGVTGVDLFIVQMTKKQFAFYKQLVDSVGLKSARIPFVIYKNSVVVGILGEINERETFTPPITRVALNLESKSHISTTLTDLPEKFDFTDFNKLIKKCRIAKTDVIPFIRRPAGVRNGIPFYEGMPASFYVGLFSKDYHVQDKLLRLLDEVDKIKQQN